MTLFGKEHVDRYVETDGAEGYDWHGTTILLLSTVGRKSGREYIHPLIYRDYANGDGGDGYLVVASKGGSNVAPDWHLNLLAHPEVDVQIKGEKFRAARPGGHAGDEEAGDVGAQGGGLAGLRQLPAEDRSRDPGGRAGANQVVRVLVAGLPSVLGPTTTIRQPQSHGRVQGSTRAQARAAECAKHRRSERLQGARLVGQDRRPSARSAARAAARVDEAGRRGGDATNWAWPFVRWWTPSAATAAGTEQLNDATAQITELTEQLAAGGRRRSSIDNPFHPGSLVGSDGAPVRSAGQLPAGRSRGDR